MTNHAGEAERLVLCFDPSAAFVESGAEHLVISPRWGRLRRRPPLLASSPAGHGPDGAWLNAREALLRCPDRTIQRALATYQCRVRMRTLLPAQTIQEPGFDLDSHCHLLLDRWREQKTAAVVRREAFWIRSLPPHTDGSLQFEFGNCFLIPITESAIDAEARAIIL